MKQKKGNWFFKLLSVLFIIYVGLFIAHKTGYYEKTIRDRTLMTEDKIKEFESDVANNVAIDINSYLPEKEDYSNIFTKGANVISDKLGKLLDSKTDSIWSFIKSLFIG